MKQSKEKKRQPNPKFIAGFDGLSIALAIAKAVNHVASTKGAKRQAVIDLDSQDYNVID